jgi:hypothetical protein
MCGLSTVWTDSTGAVYFSISLPMTITLLAKKGGGGKSTVCLLLHEAFKKAGKRGRVAILKFGSSGRTRTYNPSVNSRMLYH